MKRLPPCLFCVIISWAALAFSVAAVTILYWQMESRRIQAIAPQPHAAIECALETTCHATVGLGETVIVEVR